MLKKLLVLPVATALALTLSPAALACGDDAAAGVCETKAAPAEKVMGEEVTEKYEVAGLKCDNCVQGVTNKLGSLKGVNKVAVDLKSHTATVTYVKGHMDLDKLNAALGGHIKLSAAGEHKHDHKGEHDHEAGDKH